MNQVWDKQYSKQACAQCTKWGCSSVPPLTFSLMSVARESSRDNILGVSLRWPLGVWAEEEVLRMPRESYRGLKWKLCCAKYQLVTVVKFHQPYWSYFISCNLIGWYRSTDLPLRWIFFWGSIRLIGASITQPQRHRVEGGKWVVTPAQVWLVTYLLRGGRGEKEGLGRRERGANERGRAKGGWEEGWEGG